VSTQKNRLGLFSLTDTADGVLGFGPEVTALNFGDAVQAVLVAALHT
jgi:hypothetical protein